MNGTNIPLRVMGGKGGLGLLVERRTGTPLTHVRFQAAAREFCSQRQLSVQALRVQSLALTSVRTSKIM